MINESLDFKFGRFNLICPEIYFPHLKEIFIFDIYRTNLLNKNDIVLDAGASTGDFCIIASKKIGEEGKVIAIEPNVKDYEILKLNIKRNDCKNIIAVNSGLGNESREEEITYYGNTFRFKIKTLEEIISELNIPDKINFIKMDIEGFEVDVISKSIRTVDKADVISIELHGKKAKEDIDNILLPRGFLFKPVTMRHIYKNIIKNLFFHPYTSYKMYLDTIIKNPAIIHKAITGIDITKDFLVNGSYIKKTEIT